MKLFEQGLADPRGCEYRQIEITVHSIWGGAVTVKTHGWVLPQSVKAAQHFVIGWNGLIYPALSIGATANLKEDVLAAIEADEAQSAKAANTRQLPLYRFRMAWSEGQAVSHRSLLPLKAALLLRLGENVLAKQVWTAWTSQMDPKLNDDALLLHDPYLMLAEDWSWARFERILCAHRRGDDRWALNELRLLELLRNRIADTMAERSASWPAAYKGNAYLKSYYFAFLESVPLLLADQERRSKLGHARESLQAILGRNQKKIELIGALINELDEATAYQRGQPGGVDMSDDLIVQALIKEADDAVEPLLTVLERDNRLTRSISFHRDFGRQRHVIFVYEAAYRALAAILKLSQQESITDWEHLRKAGIGGRQHVAARLRTLWRESKIKAPD